MATLNELIALIDSKIPDVGSVEIDPLDIRACLYAIIASNGGQSNSTVASVEGAVSIISAALIGKTVSLIIGDGFSKSTGFNQPTFNGTLTLTDGSSFPGGPVAIFYA